MGLGFIPHKEQVRCNLSGSQVCFDFDYFVVNLGRLNCEYVFFQCQNRLLLPMIVIASDFLVYGLSIPHTNYSINLLDC